MAKMSAREVQQILAQHEAIITGARETIETKARALTKEDIDAIMVAPPRDAETYHLADTYSVAEVHEVIITRCTIGFIAYASMQCDFEYESYDPEFGYNGNSDEFVNMDVVITGTIQNGQFFITTIFAEYTPDQACFNKAQSIAEEEGDGCL